MSKAAIVTITSYTPNYGNSLQNYATRAELLKLGVSSDTLCFIHSKNWYYKTFFKQFLQKISTYRLGGDRFYWECTVERIKKFYLFHKVECPYIFVESTDGLADRYDYFVAGSDQIWNPSWYNGNDMMKNMYLLTFARPEQKVCMAPSFGVSEIPDEWKKYFKQQIMTFPMLSIREESGAELIKNLTGREAKVVIDPTLMLSQDEWNRIEKNPMKIDTDRKYALLYFLGNISEQRQQYIDSLLADNRLIAIKLNDKNDVNLYSADPGEFLYLISNAEIVLTDSFHACVFSFIYERPFQVFDREGTETAMFSRIENLLGMFHLGRKYVNSGLENDLFECDYSEGKQVLEVERKKALSFLKESLHLK